MKNLPQNKKQIVPNPPKMIEEYLIQWRLSLFQSIRHKELIIWSFLAFYIAALGIILGKPAQIDIHPMIGAIAIFFLSILGIMVVMDAAIWQARNLFTISRIEKLFINNNAGQLIPKSYLEYKFRYTSIYEVQIFFFSAISIVYYALFALPYISHRMLTVPSNTLPFILVTIAVICGFGWIAWWEKRLIMQMYYGNFRNLFNTDIGGGPLDQVSEGDRIASVLTGPGRMCARWAIATITAIATGVLGLSLVKECPCTPYIFTIIPILWSIFWLVAVFLWWRDRKFYVSDWNFDSALVVVSFAVFMTILLMFVVANLNQFDPKLILKSI